MRSRLITHADASDCFRFADFASAWQSLRGTRIDKNRLRCVDLVETDAGSAYVKRFSGLQVKNAIKLRTQEPRVRSQAERERRIIEALARSGFRPPQWLACGEQTRLGYEVRSLIVTAPLDGRQLAEVEVDDARVLDVAEHLGNTVAAGVFLPDLGLDHVWLMRGGGYGLLDFHNARCTRRPSPRELGRAIVRFFKSPGGNVLLARGLLDPFAAAYLAAAVRTESAGPVRKLCRERLGA